MQIGAQDLAIGGPDAFGAAIDEESGAIERTAGGDTHMDFIATDGGAVFIECTYTLYLRQAFFRAHFSHHIHQPQSWRSAGLTFQALRVGNAAAHHLEAAANADDLAVVAQVM